jgi:hypothetical protein
VIRLPFFVILIEPSADTLTTIWGQFGGAAAVSIAAAKTVAKICRELTSVPPAS